MPRHLMNLRNSLDMKHRKKKKENYETAEILLPQLKTYENQTSKREESRKNQRKKKGDE